MPTTIKRHDTWPPLRFLASDDAGAPLPLDQADSLKLILKSGTTTLIEATAEALDPDTNDGFNGQYTWEAAETNVLGNYQIELEITWDANSSPPRIETVPNTGVKELVIEADLA